MDLLVVVASFLVVGELVEEEFEVDFIEGAPLMIDGAVEADMTLGILKGNERLVEAEEAAETLRSSLAAAVEQQLVSADLP